MLPPGLNSPREVVAHYDAVYDNLITSGEKYPFLYPWASLGALVVILYMLVDHRRSYWLERCRFPVYAFLCIFELWCLVTNRAKNPAAAFGVGLVSSWGVLWVGAVMVFNDCQRDFRRIERRDGVRGHVDDECDTSHDGVPTNGHATGASLNGELRQRSLNNTKTTPANNTSQGPSKRSGTLYWQEYPSQPFIERLDWVADVFCSFRLVGWNKQTNGVPPPPSWAQAQLDGEKDSLERPESPTISKTGIRRYSDRRALLRLSLIRLLIGYIALDAIKTLTTLDPYFWGYTDSPPPTHLPTLFQASPVLTKSYRLLLSLSAVYTALATIFALGPIFFCGLLGPRILGLRGEPWLNPPDMYGHFASNVLDKGLAGWWGGWWHQTFRFGFEAPSTRLLDALHIDPRSLPGKTIALFVAFLLSGCLHACGSYTQLGDTRPLAGPMAFFLLQACGIMIQMALTQVTRSAGLASRIPTWVVRGTNLVAVHVWLYYTAPLLVEDFSRGGVWLFEPVPVSLFRGLGLGWKDEGWWCWGGGAMGWRSGDHWWDTGIAL